MQVFTSISSSRTVLLADTKTSSLGNVQVEKGLIKNEYTCFGKKIGLMSNTYKINLDLIETKLKKKRHGI